VIYPCAYRLGFRVTPVRYPKGPSTLQRVAACCSVLQCVAVCCSVLITHTCIHIHTCSPLREVRARWFVIDVCVCTHPHFLPHTYTRTHMHTPAHTRTPTPTHSRTHTHTHTHTHVCIQFAEGAACEVVRDAIDAYELDALVFVDWTASHATALLLTLCGCVCVWGGRR